MAKDEPIALVGMSCRFPGAPSLSEYWDLLREGRDAIGPVPEDRLLLREAVKAGLITDFGGFIPDVDLFDANFFGFSGREATVTDPQLRVLCEVVWEALEDAGQNPHELKGSDASIIVGAIAHDFLELTVDRPDEWDLYGAVNNMHASLAGRLAFFFDVHGTAMSVDTACASSLLSLHLACQTIHRGESDLAVAATTHLVLRPAHTQVFENAGVQAKDGRCKPFDSRGDGFVRADGAGAIIVKRLSRAIEDGDRIYAVVRGSLPNHDGGTGQYKTPNVNGQRKLVRDLYARTEIDPLDVQYVEVHGTGTRAGDPVEASALIAEMCQGRSLDDPLRVGSVKSNIGHCEGAAGLAGLIKVALSLRHGQLPPSLHFEKGNPAIPWDEAAFRVQTKLEDWPRKEGQPARAGVSAFGLSGVNCHIVLEEPPAMERPKPRVASSGRDEPRLLVASGLTGDALNDNMSRLVECLRSPAAPSLVDACYSAGRRRAHHPYRAAVVARSVQQAADELEAAARGDESPYVTVTDTPSEQRPKITFSFPGQGAQWFGMARGLLESNAAFREEMERCDAAIKVEGGFSVIEQLQASEDDSRLGDIGVLQPTLFAMQAALVAAWRGFGVIPSAVVGHSMGEVAASYTAGILTLEDAVKVICRRSHLMRRLRGRGAMLVVERGRAEAEELVRGRADKISFAVHNSPASTVLSGDVEELEGIQQVLEKAGVFTRHVKVDVASHSAQVDPIEEDLREALADLAPRPRRIPLYSTVRTKFGRRDEDGEKMGADYWWDNLRQPVLFADAVAELIQDGHELFIEISPHPLLTQAVTQSKARTPSTVALASMRREEDESEVMLRTLAQVYARGGALAWDVVVEQGEVCDLPNYAWQRERFAINYSRPSGGGAASGAHPLLGNMWQAADRPNEFTWETEISLDAFPYIEHHKVQGEAVFPAAGYVEMAFAAGRTVFDGNQMRLQDVSFEQALFLGETDRRRLQLVVRRRGDAQATFLFYRLEEGGEPAVLVRGSMAMVERDREPGLGCSEEDIKRLRDSALATHDRDEFYAAMNGIGLMYGPLFQGIREAHYAEGEGLVRLEIPEEIKAESDRYLLHPAMLDPVMQCLFSSLARDSAGPVLNGSYVPVNVHNMALHGTRGRDPAWARCVLKDRADDDQTFEVDITLLDAARQPILSYEGLRATRLAQGNGKSLSDRLMHQTRWQEKSLPAGAEDKAFAEGAWLVLLDADGVGDRVAAQIETTGAPVVRISRVRRATDKAGMFEKGHYRVRSCAAEELAPALEELKGAAPAVAGVVYCWPMDARLTSSTTVDAAERETLDACLGLLNVLKVAAEAETPLGRLWTVTSGATADDATVSLNAAPQAAVWNMGRVIATEHPQLRCARIDVRGGIKVRADYIVGELRADTDDDEVAISEAGRKVASLVREPLEATRDDRPPEPAGDRPYRLAASGFSDLQCVLRPLSVRDCAPGEARVEVRAAAAIAADAAGARSPDMAAALGYVCAGTVSAVGEGTSLRAGDAVICIASGSLATHVHVDAGRVFAKPTALSFEEAAALPITYGVAQLALSLARLEKGQRVLVDLSSGAMGHAALALAARAGATAQLVAPDADAGAALRERTGLDVTTPQQIEAEGPADVVISGGIGVPAVGPEALRAFGTLVDVGGDALSSAGRLESVTVTQMDLRSALAQCPPALKQAMNDVLALVQEGLPAPNLRAFSVEETGAALAAAEAGETAVVRLGRSELPLRVDGSPLRPDGSYLITGGLGGLGLVIADSMAAEGAGTLVLMGRSAPSEAALEAIARIEQRGTRVIVARGDVADPEGLTAALPRFGTDISPLRGVVHSAGVLADATFLNLDEAAFKQVFTPKVRGTWNLCTQLDVQKLDFFVLFSSGAGLIGSPGQGNYAAANGFMDGLVRAQARAGGRAHSIQWGAWADVGLAATPDRGGRLDGQGLVSMRPVDGVAMFQEVLRSVPGEVGVMDFDVLRWQEAHPSAAKSVLLEELREAASSTGGEAKSGGSVSVLERLQAAVGEEDRKAVLVDYVSGVVGATLRVRQESLDQTRSILALGMDSLMGVEMRNKLESVFSIQVPISALLKGPSIVEVSRLIYEKVADTLDQEGGSEQAADGTTARPGPWPEDLKLDDDIAPAAAITYDGQLGKDLFLTGATGFLGSYVAAALLKRERARVYCLVRAENEEEANRRLKESFTSRELWREEWQGRVIAIPGDLAKPRLGLSEERFAELAGRLDEIFHIGFHVNFLASYEDLRAANVSGTKEILRLASTHRAKPVHFSSTFAVHLTREQRGQVAYEDGELRGALSSGYGQTKHAAEKLMLAARERSLPVSVYRPAAIGWHVDTGAFNERELMARFISSAIMLGRGPDLDALLYLTPVEVVANAIVDIASKPENLGRNYHVTAPQPVSWKSLVECLREEGFPIDLVPYEQWLASVSGDGGQGPMGAFAASFPKTLGDKVVDLPGFSVRDLMPSRFDTANLRQALGDDLPGQPLEHIKRFIGRLKTAKLV